MSVCLVEYIALGKTYLVVQDPQPSTFANCVYVAPSGSEIANSPFSLSTVDAQSLGYAIVALWAVAFGFRALIKSLRGHDRGEEQD